MIYQFWLDRQVIFSDHSQILCHFQDSCFWSVYVIRNLRLDEMCVQSSCLSVESFTIFGFSYNFYVPWQSLRLHPITFVPSLSQCHVYYMILLWNQPIIYEYLWSMIELGMQLHIINIQRLEQSSYERPNFYLSSSESYIAS